MSSSTLTVSPHSLTPAASRKLVLIAAIVLGAALNLLMAFNNTTGWGEDFNQFYSAGKLAGTGQLYNWEALRKLEDQHGTEVPTARLPVVIFGAKLIGWMPYSVARVVWLLVNLIALVVFVFAWPHGDPAPAPLRSRLGNTLPRLGNTLPLPSRARPQADRSLMAVAIAWSMPIGLLLVLGQDTPIWLMLTALGLYLLHNERPKLAGVVFALGICKFHLGVGILILLLAQKRWNTVLAASASGVALLGACFPIEGPAWPLRYLEILRRPEFNPAVYRMPSLAGIAYWFPASAAIEIILTIAVAALLWMVCRNTRDLGLTGAAATGAGLILAHHCYANDCALLIPLLAFIVMRPEFPRWLKLAAVVLFTPAPVFLLTTNKPFVGQFLIVAFVIAALAVARTAAPSPTAIE